MSITHARPVVRRLDDLAWLVNAGFQEMPGMRLTFAQVKRLWTLSTDDCTAILDYLLSSGVLTQDDDDQFCRFDS